MDFYYFILKPLDTWPSRDICDCVKDRQKENKKAMQTTQNTFSQTIEW